MIRARSFLDTNVLVYLYDDDEAEKQQIAWDTFDELIDRGDAILSTQVLQEFYVTVTRKLASPMAESDALAVVRRLTEFQVVPIEGDLVVQAIELSQQHQLSLWDALIVQAALESGAGRLLTEDLQDGWVVGGLEVVNPFSSGG